MEVFVAQPLASPGSANNITHILHLSHQKDASQNLNISVIIETLQPLIQLYTSQPNPALKLQVASRLSTDKFMLVLWRQQPGRISSLFTGA